MNFELTLLNFSKAILEHDMSTAGDILADLDLSSLKDNELGDLRQMILSLLLEPVPVSNTEAETIFEKVELENKEVFKALVELKNANTYNMELDTFKELKAYALADTDAFYSDFERDVLRQNLIYAAINTRNTELIKDMIDKYQSH